MIAVNLQVTELAAGYALIQDFLQTMRSEYLPGFELAYQRRSKEYQRAMDKYEQRGLFLRTLLGKPQAPQRLPARYPGALASRLIQDWHASFSLAVRNNAPAGDELSERLDERFLTLTDLRLAEDRLIERIIIGPQGILLVDQDERAPAASSRNGDAGADLRAATAAILEPSLENSIYMGDPAAWPDSVTGKKLDPQTVFHLADVLLAHHQQVVQVQPFSALTTAEKLTAREKDNLLRMAATL